MAETDRWSLSKPDDNIRKMGWGGKCMNLTKYTEYWGVFFDFPVLVCNNRRKKSEALLGSLM